MMKIAKALSLKYFVLNVTFSNACVIGDLIMYVCEKKIFIICMHLIQTVIVTIFS